MRKAISYTHYVDMKNAYGRVCSVHSEDNNMFEINVKAYLPSKNKVIEQNFSVNSNNNYVTYKCNDKLRLLNFRVGFAPKEWSCTRYYIPGEVVIYKGKVYSAIERMYNREIPTDNRFWKEAISYQKKNYAKNDAVLYGDNRYYVAIADVSSSELPQHSSNWKKVYGDFTLYCGINESGCHFETTVIDGNENFIELYPFDCKTYYTLDGYYEVINGVNYNIPVIKGFDGLEYGRIFAIEDGTKTDTIITRQNDSGSTLYHKIIEVIPVKDMNIMYALRIENMYNFDTPVFGFVRGTLISSDGSSINGTLRGFGIGENFNKSNFNIHVTKDNGTTLVYFSSPSNRYRITIESLDSFSNEVFTKNLSSSIIDIHNNPQETTSMSGTIIENLFW